MRERVSVEIERVATSGEGVARRGELEVRVAGAFPGERALVEIRHRSRQHPRAVGALIELERAHPARRASPCDRHERARGRCGGCPLMELDEAAQREAKRAMLASLGLEVAEVVAGPSLAYRASSKRVAFGRAGRLRLGSWARGTHQGADMGGCLVDHPLVVEAAAELAREADAIGVVPFDEARGEGDLRYVWLKTDGARVLVTLVTASEDTRVHELAPRLSRAAGVAWSVQPARGNAIRGSSPRLLAGDATLAVTIAGVPIEVGPLGFLQPSPRAIELAYLDLLRDEGGAALRGALAWDLYAGAGVTSALLARAFDRVVPCESYPESAEALGVEPCTVERFLDRARDAPETPALIVANPPRKGLGDEVTQRLARVAAPRLHVMSCGPEGLARDLAALRRAGYRVASLTAYDTLPQTPHVELVAKLVLGKD